MNRIRRLLRHSEVLLLVSWLGFVLFNWPLLGLFNLKSLEDIFLYLFLMWAIFILVLIIISIGYLRTDGA